MASTPTALRIVEGSSMDKTKALSAALSQIERQFGKGSVMKLGKNDRSMDVETISSGSLGLDIALGVGHADCFAERRRRLGRSRSGQGRPRARP